MKHDTPQKLPLHHRLLYELYRSFVFMKKYRFFQLPGLNLEMSFSYKPILSCNPTSPFPSEKHPSKEKHFMVSLYSLFLLAKKGFTRFISEPIISFLQTYVSFKSYIFLFCPSLIKNTPSHPK